LTHGIFVSGWQHLTVDPQNVSEEGRHLAEDISVKMNLPLAACLRAQAATELYCRLEAQREALDAMEGADDNEQ
jgi:hypothetical protein